MASGYETEQEQLEAIRRWWSENGRSVITGVVIALLAFGGWQWWQYRQGNQNMAAAAHYETLQSALDGGESERAAETLQVLQEDHAGSVQAVLASLRAAAARVEAGDLEAGATALRWAMENAPVEALERLARLRLAKVLDTQGEREAALALLQPVPEGPFAARYHELAGDVQAALGKTEAAVTAYREAIQADPLNRRRGVIEMKLGDLGAEPETPS